MKTLHLFAGAGGGLLADLILGHEPIGAVEWDPYCCEILRERSADGWFPGLRVHEGDIREFDASEYAGSVGCVAGGFPCQDISAAGKGAGLDGERSGLWSEFARVIRDVRPRFAFIENSPMLTLRGLDRVLCDLAALGFDAEWAVISAADAGASHLRERIWILAHASGARRSGSGVVGRLAWRAETVGAGEAMANPSRIVSRHGHGGAKPSFWPANAENESGWEPVPDADQRRTEPDMGRMADGLADGSHAPSWWQAEPEKIPRVAQNVPDRVARLKALGNGQVPLQAALAWRVLSQRIAA